MSEILCVTNRALCRGDFLARIESVAAARPSGVILREKDLPETEYEELAAQAAAICGQYGVRFICHSYAAAAEELGIRALHLPLPLLREMEPVRRQGFFMLGASCHSVLDALEAQALGCTYVTAGHIFDTDCKKGTPGRGLDFLREVCREVEIPVYAIGGISPQNAAAVAEAGAAGVCVMSGAMTCADPKAYFSAFASGGK